MLSHVNGRTQPIADRPKVIGRSVPLSFSPVQFSGPPPKTDHPALAPRTPGILGNAKAGLERVLRYFQEGLQAIVRQVLAGIAILAGSFTGKPVRGRTLLRVERDGVAELQGTVSAVLCNASGKVLNQVHVLDSRQQIIARSTIKPLHAALLHMLRTQHQQQHPEKPLPPISPEEWAVMSASHSGSEIHTRWVKSVLDKNNLSPDYMVCEPTLPHDATVRTRMIRDGKSPEVLHHMCSGHHACLGLYSGLIGESPQTYRQATGKLQQELMTELQKWLGNKAKLRPVEFDNCNIPSIAMSMPELATLFARLVSDPATQPVVESMAAHPVLVSDEASLDTCLMQVSGGNLIAKLGAGGMIVVANRTTRQAVVLKEWEGVSAHRDRATIQALAALGWLNVDQVATLHARPEFRLFDPRTRTRYHIEPDIWQEAI